MSDAHDLLDATVNGLCDKILAALEAGVDVNMKNVDGETALCLAAEKGYYEICQILLEHGANVNALSEWDEVPLHRASEEGHENVVRLLLEKGADVNVKGFDDCTPLHYASQEGHVEVVKCLLAHGAHVNAIDSEMETALHWASESDWSNEDVVRLLLEKGAGINLKAENGSTPLHYASDAGRSEIVSYLLAHGADVHSTDNYKDNALHDASRMGHKEVVLCLLQNGAKVGKQNIDKETPTTLALKNNHFQIADILEKYPLYKAALRGEYKLCQRLIVKETSRDPVDVLKANYVLNPTAAALKGGHQKLVNFFLQRKLNVDYDNIVNEIPSIFWAINRGQVEVVTYLLDCGADPNTTFNGDTIIHQATHKRRADLVRLLLLKGADLNRKDHRGWTPLHYAVMNGEEDIVTHLLEHNADVNAVTTNRDTPLHLAFAGVRHKIGQLLINKGADVEAMNSDNEKPSDVLNKKWTEHQRIADMMRVVAESKNDESSSTSTSDLVRDDVSDSDATVKYPCLAKLSDFDGPMKAIDVQSLRSKMDELLALVLEIEDLVVDAKEMQADLTREAEAAANLQQKLDNIQLKRELTKNTTESKFEEMSKSLTEKQNETKRKESELENEIAELRKNIVDLNVKKKLIYQEIGQLL